MDFLREHTSPLFWLLAIMLLVWVAGMQRPRR